MWHIVTFICNIYVFSTWDISCVAQADGIFTNLLGQLLAEVKQVGPAHSAINSRHAINSRPFIHL